MEKKETIYNEICGKCGSMNTFALSEEMVDDEYVEEIYKCCNCGMIADEMTEEKEVKEDGTIIITATFYE